MYVNPNFSTKKQLIEAIASGTTVTVSRPGLFSKITMINGSFDVEGPHRLLTDYPQEQNWFGKVRVENSRVVEVIS